MNAKPYLQYCYAVFLTLLVECSFLCYVGIWPFGNGSFALIDNAQQVAPFLASLKLIVSGVEDWSWSFLSGGINRTALLTGYHLYFSPTVWLACLLPADSCLQSLSWLFLIQIACSSAAALFYLRRTFPHCPDALKLALALSYTFSDFVFTKYTDLRFLNISALFPLFLYALDLLLKRGKYWPCLLISTYMMAVAPYFFWMWGVFSVLYVAAWQGMRWNPKVRLRLLLFCGVTVVSLLLSVWCWLPSVAATSESARGSMGTSIYSPRIPMGFRLFQMWMISPLVLLPLIGAKRIKKVLRSRFALTLLLLIVWCCVIPLNHAFHMGEPMDFPVRFSYMLSMMSCCWVAFAFNREKICIKTAQPSIRRLLAIICLFSLLCLFSGSRCVEILLWCAAVVTAVVMGKGGYCYLLLVFACSTHVFNYHQFQQKWATKVAMTGAPRISCAERLGEVCSDRLGGCWGRIKSVDFCLSENFAEVSDLNSFCNFFHSSTKEQQIAAHALGYLHRFTRIHDIGGTLFSDSFMGCELLVSHHSYLDALLPLEVSVEGLPRVYRNPYYWGDGVVVAEEKVASAKEYGEDAIENQQQLFEELGGDGDLFAKDTLLLQPTSDKRLFARYITKGGEFIYMGSAPLQSSFDDDSWYNERLATIDFAKSADFLIQLPSSESGEVNIPIAYIKSTEQVHKENMAVCSSTNLYRLNTDRLSRLAEKLRGKVRISSIQGREMDVEVDADAASSVLLLPYFYHKGYRAEDESGAALRVFEHRGFTAVSLVKAGKQRVRLTYSLPLEKVSQCVSFISLLLLLLAYAVFGRMKNWSLSSSFVNGMNSMLSKAFVFIACGAMIASLPWFVLKVIFVIQLKYM